jgi:hypothetical protein
VVIKTAATPARSARTSDVHPAHKRALYAGSSPTALKAEIALKTPIKLASIPKAMAIPLICFSFLSCRGHAVLAYQVRFLYQ